MPDRILRSGIISSESVNKLSWAAEVFYRRLMSVVDDYGRYDGRPSVMRASLYPLKLDNVSEPDVAKWLAECAKAALVRDYVVSGKRYVELLNFGQRIRTASKWPPDDILPQSAADCSMVDTPPNTHSNTNPKGKGGSGERVFSLLKAEVGKHFERKVTDRWSYEEEYDLAEVCKRPAADSEWLEIVAFRRKAGRDGEKLKATVKSLLEGWGSELDRARKYKPEKSMATQKTVPASKILVDVKDPGASKETLDNWEQLKARLK